MVKLFPPSTHQPSAKDGVVHINNLTTSEEEVISLDGGWIYYPGQFVNSENKGVTKRVIAIRIIPKIFLR